MQQRLARIVSLGAHIAHARAGPKRRWCARESGRREPVIRYSVLCAQYGGLRNSEWVLKIAAFGVLVFAA